MNFLANIYMQDNIFVLVRIKIRWISALKLLRVAYLLLNNCFENLYNII